MSGTTTSSIFVARFAGDVFPDSRKNDLVIYTDLPSQQILIGAKTSPDGEGGDDFPREALVISDSNVRIPGVAHFDNEINMNGALRVNEEIVINGEFTVNSEMTMVNRLNVTDAKLEGELHVVSEETGDTVLYAAAGSNILLNEDTDVRVRRRFRVITPSSSSSDVVDGAAFEVDDEESRRGVYVGLPLFASREAAFEGDVRVRDGTFSVTDSNVQVGARLDVRAPLVTYDDFVVFAAPGGGTGDLVLAADGQKVAIHRRLDVSCNVAVAGDAAFTGPTFRMTPRDSDTPAVSADDSLVRVTREFEATSNVRVLGDAAFTGGSLAFSPDDDNPDVEIDAAALYVDDSCTTLNVLLCARSNADVTGDLTIFDSTNFTEDETPIFTASSSAQEVRCFRDTFVEGAELTVKNGDDGAGNAWPALTVKDSGVSMFRSVLVDSNAEITDGLTVHGDATVFGETVLDDGVRVRGDTRLRHGSLTVDPTGGSVVFSAEANKVEVTRRLEARCNLTIGGDLQATGGLKVEAGGTIAFEVDAQSVTSYREVEMNSNVRVVDADLTLSDGTFDVTYTGTDNPSNSALSVRDVGGVNVRRDLDVVGDTSMTGDLSVLYNAEGGSGPAFRVERGAGRRIVTSDLDWRVEGAGIDVFDGTHFTFRVDNESNVVSDTSDAGVDVFRRLRVMDGAGLEVDLGDGEEGYFRVRRAGDGGIDAKTLGVFAVDAGEESVFYGKVRCAASSASSSNDILTVENDGIEATRRLSVRCNIDVQGGDLRIRDGEFEVSWPPTVENNGNDIAFSITDEQALFRRDVRVAGGAFEVRPVASGENAALAVTDSGINATRDVSVSEGCNLTVQGGGALSVRGDGGRFEVVTSGAQDAVASLSATDDAVTVRRYMDVANDTTRFEVSEAFEVIASSPSSGLPLLEMNDEYVKIGRDTHVRSNLTVAGDVDIAGTVRSDRFTIENDLIVGGDTDLSGVLRVSPSSSNDATTLTVSDGMLEVEGDVVVRDSLDVTTGRVRLRRGDFTIFDDAEAMTPLFSVLAEDADSVVDDGRKAGVTARAELHAECNVDASRDVLVRGALTVNTVSTFDGSEIDRALYADNDRVEINRDTEVTGDVDVRGNLAVREAGGGAVLVLDAAALEVRRDALLRCNLRVDGAVAFDSPDSVLTFGSNVMTIAPDKVTIREDLDVEGDRTRIYSSNTDVFGRFRVNPVQAGVPVLDVRDTRVEVNRRLDVKGGDVGVSGNVRVDSNLAVYGNTDLYRPLVVRPGGVDAPRVLTVDAAQGVKVGADLEASSNLNVLGNASFVGGSLFRVDTAQGGRAFSASASNIELRRGVNVASNLAVAGDATLSGEFTVGPDENVGFAIDADRVQVSGRDLRVSDAAFLVDSGNSTLRGDLSVAPGGFEVLAVDGDEVEMNRPLRLIGAADVSGNLTVRHQGTPSLEVREAEVRLHRRLDTSCNVTVRGISDLRGDLSVRPSSSSSEAFAVTDGGVKVSRDIEAEGSLSVGGATDISGDLSVTLEGFLAASVTNEFVRVCRDLDVKSNLSVDADANIRGDLRVNPGGLDVLRVNGLSVDVDRDLNVDGDVTVTGEVNSMSDARIKTNLRPIQGALDKVRRLKGYVYNRSDYDGHDKKLLQQRTTTNNKSSERDLIGFVAQEVLEVVPEVVRLDAAKTGLYSVCYANMVALLTEGIKEMAADNARLSERVTALEKR